MSHRCAKYVPHLSSPLERVMQVRKDRRPYRLRPLSAYHVIPAQAGIQGCAGAPPRPRGTRGSAAMDDFSPSDLKTILHSKRANMYYLQLQEDFIGRATTGPTSP